MSYLITKSQIAVRYAETDQMGVVHHSLYPVYFEQGRTDFFIEHLVPYARFEEQGIFAPLLSYSVDIKGRLSYGDTLDLEVVPTLFRGLRLGMKYKGYSNSKLVVEGQSIHALTGPNFSVLHPRKLPPLYSLLKERFIAHLESARAR